MNAEAIKTWLERKRKTESASCLVLGLLAFVGGLVVVFLTFWFAYAIIWFAWQGVSALGDLMFGKRPQLSHELRLLCSGLFIVLLFVQHRRTNPWHWGEYPARRDYSFAAGHLLGPAALLFYPGASANMVADILLSGPRLVFGSFALWRKAGELRRLEVTGCGDLLAYLVAVGRSVPYADLSSAGWDDWLPQLRAINGVLFLEKGITLSEDLRRELATLPKD